MTQDVQERKRTLKTVYKALKGNAHNAELHRAAAALNEQLEWYKEAVPHLAFLASKTSGADEHLYARYVRALQRSMAPAKSLDVCDQGLKLFPNSSVLLKNRALT